SRAMSLHHDLLEQAEHLVARERRVPRTPRPPALGPCPVAAPVACKSSRRGRLPTYCRPGVAIPANDRDGPAVSTGGFVEPRRQARARAPRGRPGGWPGVVDGLGCWMPRAVRAGATVFFPVQNTVAPPARVLHPNACATPTRRLDPARAPPAARFRPDSQGGV